MLLQMIMKRSWFFVAVFGLGIILQSCLKDEADVYDPLQVLEEDIQTIEQYLLDNNLSASMDPETGIFLDMHSKGSGYLTINGADVNLNYKGVTLEGIEFVNTFDDAPETVILGQSEINPINFTAGINLGMLKLNEGDSATFYVPSPWGFQNLSYENVPPNSILIYTVKFESIKNLKEDLEKIDQYIADNNIDAVIDRDYGTRYAIHKEGNETFPEPGASVLVHYIGELLDGTEFDASYGGSPYQFMMADPDPRSRTIPGFELGVSFLHDQDSATIFIPSNYGYKDNNEIPGIPPNSVLVFGLDILSIISPTN